MEVPGRDVTADPLGPEPMDEPQREAQPPDEGTPVTEPPTPESEPATPEREGDDGSPGQ
jgi:hypothetical protein